MQLKPNDKVQKRRLFKKEKKDEIGQMGRVESVIADGRCFVDVLAADGCKNKRTWAWQPASNYKLIKSTAVEEAPAPSTCETAFAKRQRTAHDKGEHGP
jgi:hypothetical protein